MSESTRAGTVRAFAASFGTRDVDALLDCVSDDLVWEFNGTRAGEGKVAFEARMRSDLATGSAQVHIEQLVEQDDLVVALNRGRFVPHEGSDEASTEGMPFVSAEAYTFTGGRISHLRTYQPIG